MWVKSAEDSHSLVLGVRGGKGASQCSHANQLPPAASCFHPSYGCIRSLSCSWAWGTSRSRWSSGGASGGRCAARCTSWGARGRCTGFFQLTRATRGLNQTFPTCKLFVPLQFLCMEEKWTRKDDETDLRLTVPLNTISDFWTLFQKSNKASVHQSPTWYTSVMELRALREIFRTALGFGCSFMFSQVGFSGKELAWTVRSGSRLRRDIRRELSEDEERSLRKRSGASGELSASSDSSRAVCARQTPTTALPTPSISEDAILTELAWKKQNGLWRKLVFHNYTERLYKGVRILLV